MRPVYVPPPRSTLAARILDADGTVALLASIPAVLLFAIAVVLICGGPS